VIKPWTDIKAFYQQLVMAGSPLEGMVRLVEEIEASRYASGVYGPYLRISPRFDGTIEFRYIDLRP
jgi:hypothetical protein